MVDNKNEILKCWEEEVKKFRISVNIDCDLTINGIEKIEIADTIFSISKIEKKQDKSGCEKYKIVGLITERNDYTAKDILRKFIYDFFSLNSSYISIDEHYNVEIYCQHTWIFYPTAWGYGYTIRDKNDKEILVDISLIKKLYKIRDSGLSSTKLNGKIDKIFLLLKRGVLLKNDIEFSGDSFICFYKILEIISDEMKKKKYSLDAKSKNIKELAKLGLIEEIRSQKLKLYYILIYFDLSEFRIYNGDGDLYGLDKIIKLSDIRNKFSHTDVEVARSDLEAIHTLSLIMIHKFINILDKTQS